MKKRIVLSAVVAILVIFAGCLGGFDDLTSQSPTDDADGADGDATLVENRTAALMAAGSYTAVWQMTLVNSSEGETRLAYTHAVDYDNERSSFDMLTSGDGSESSDYETFHANGVSYTRSGSGEDATYNVGDAPFAPANTLFSVKSSISAGDLSEFSTTGTEIYDGVTVTRYERTDRPTWVGLQGIDAEITWTEFNYVVLVDANGLVRYDSWGAKGVNAADVEHTMEFSYTLTDVGSTSINDPDWIGEAVAQPDR